MRFRWWLTNGVMIGLALAWLYPFYLIARYGKFIVGEQSHLILAGEMALFLAIIALGIVNIIRRYD